MGKILKHAYTPFTVQYKVVKTAWLVALAQVRAALGVFCKRRLERGRQQLYTNREGRANGGRDWYVSLQL